LLNISKSPQNHRHELLLRSLPLLTDCLQTHESVYQRVPGFAEQVTVFRRLAIKMQLQEQRVLRSEIEVPIDIQAIRDSLIQACRAVSGPLAGWAAVIGDESLRCQVASTPEALRAMGPALIDQARTIAAIGRRTLNQGAAHYGVTKSALEHLDQAADAFEAAVASFPEAVPSLRTASDHLRFFLRDVMDPLVEGFLLTAPEFWSAYRQARKAKESTGSNRDSLQTATSESILSA